MLSCENIKNGNRALKAFFKQNRIFTRACKGYSWHFEHGQLWISHIDGASWSVVSAYGGRSVDGFDFEQVSYDAI